MIASPHPDFQSDCEATAK